jgi:hypothetical protein
MPDRRDHDAAIGVIAIAGMRRSALITRTRAALRLVALAS